jgi:hypothetical protein
MRDFKNILVATLALAMVLPAHPTLASANLNQEEHAMNAKKQLDCRKVITLIEQLGRTDPYDLGSFDTVRYLFSNRRFENLRDRYNAEYIAILKKADLDTGAADAELEKFWNDTCRKVTEKYMRLLMINGPLMMISEIWDVYKRHTGEYANTICQEALTGWENTADLYITHPQIRFRQTIHTRGNRQTR